MSSILLANRYNQVSEILDSTSTFNNAISMIKDKGLTKGMAMRILDLMDKTIVRTGGRGYTPEHQMVAMELKSEFEWLFFDIDEHVSEDFMNDTADKLPDIYDLMCYYVLMIVLLSQDK